MDVLALWTCVLRHAELSQFLNVYTISAGMRNVNSEDKIYMAFLCVCVSLELSDKVRGISTVGVGLYIILTR